ncbi:MAG: hypothetical protein KI790_11740 [Cyclobacteriaceae bacterium]|nr:hypothetical protein [Cyclobacteriaceae bacterium HetDA_MAG_MS6]
MMKIFLTIIVFLLLSGSVKAQVYTSEIKVEEISGDFTGIGTESPSTKLHIKTNAPEDRNEIKVGRFDNMDPLGRSGNFPSIYADYVLRIPQRVQIFGGGVGRQYLDIRDQAGGQKIKFDAEGDSYINSGDFGLGTSNPDTDLHIVRTDGTGAQIKLEAYTDHSAILGANSSGGVLNLSDGNGNTSAIIRGYGASYFNAGNVGIGTTNPTYELEVSGTVRATTFSAVSPPSWPDFVFKNNYDLRTLEEVEQHINENGRLPEIPSETEVTENGINLGEMDAKLLQKIEELTLYLIQQNKKIEELEQKVKELGKD